MLKQLNRNKKKKGFTLIELVIVLAVLAIIALIAIPNFTKVRNDSMFKADERAAEQIEKITLMAIANEDIKTPGKYELEFKANSKEFDNVSGPSTNNNIGNYKQMLNEVNRPQMGTANSYVVVVDSNLAVTVKYKTAVDHDGNATTDPVLTLTK